jgi:predicted metal-dependent HD superfamily phosphohydrolase
MQPRLQQAWASLAYSLGAPADLGERVRRLLEDRYGEAHRAYHTLDHIAQVLDTVDTLAAAGEPVQDLAAIRLAAWFHDAVYDPRRSDNEFASADLAGEVLEDWPLDAARRRRVRRLILATADHIARTADERVLVDADLAILASDPQDYQAYIRAIRYEYAWLPEETFRAGRAAFLEGMCAREHLFATATMRTQAEIQALRNLQAELDDLQTGGG